MTDEPANAEPRAVDRLAAMLDRPLTELTVDELMALKKEFEARGVLVYNRFWASPEMLALLAAASIYSKAFLETWPSISRCGRRPAAQALAQERHDHRG